MNKELFIKAITRFFAGLVIVCFLLFLPAGTFRYPQGRLLLGILFVPMFIAGIIMMKKNPELLEKRLNVKEKETEQKEVILFSGIMFLAAFIIAGLSFRFGWLMLPFPASILAAIIFLAAYALYAEVLRENTYLSRTIEVQENQKVIDTGLYGIRPASDVHGDGISVSCHAAGAGIRHFFCDHALLHTDHCKTDTK